MKQQSMFTWLQRSPENQQKRVLSSDAANGPTSPAVKPLPSEKTTASEKKAPMACTSNLSANPAPTTLKSPTARKTSKSKENKEKKPNAAVLPSSPFAAKPSSSKVPEKKVVPATTESISAKNSKEEPKKIETEEEAMSVDSPVTISTDNEDNVETVPPPTKDVVIPSETSKEVAKPSEIMKEVATPTENVEEAVKPMETNVLSSDSDSEAEQVKQLGKSSLFSLWNKSGKLQKKKVSSATSAGPSTTEPAATVSAPPPPPPQPVVKIVMPPVREIVCPDGFNPARIPDVLVVTEFLRNFGCLLQKKGSRKPLDPEPDFHILLNALGCPPSHDPLYLCGIIFHLVSFVAKQAVFSKVRYLGQPLPEFDLSVQSGPEILRIFLSSLPAKSLVPALSNEIASKWVEKGFFALSPNERLDVLLSTVNWLVSTPTVIDYMTKKEDAVHKLRSDLLRLRKKQIKDKASLKAAQSVENNENIEEMFENLEAEEDSEEEKPRASSSKPRQNETAAQAASLTQLAAEIAEMKLAVDKAEQEFNQVRCHVPIGTDHEGSVFWRFPTFSMNSADKAAVVENKETWSYYNLDDLFDVISSLRSNPFAGDFNLRVALESVVKELQANQQEESSDNADFFKEDVSIPAGILDEVTDNLLDSEARIYAAAFADPLPDVDDWHSRVKSPLPEDRPKILSQCLLTLANSVHLRVVIPSAKVSPETLEKKQEEADGEEKKKNPTEENPLFFASDSYFAKWKAEVAQTESPSRLLLLLDIFLQWLQWSMSAHNARCRRCRRGPNSGVLILCDKCNRSYHFRCLDPPLKEAPEGEWFCPECAKKEHLAKQQVEQQDSDIEAVSDDEVDNESEYEPEDSDEEVECEFREPDTECKECRGPATDSDELISCSICYHSFHLDCLGLRYPPRGAWYCAKCVKSKNKRQTRRRVICDSPPSPPKPKARAVKRAASKRTTRSSTRDVPSRTSSRQTTSRASNNRSASPMAELCERYSFRPRAKRM